MAGSATGQKSRWPFTPLGRLFPSSQPYPTRQLPAPNESQARPEAATMATAHKIAVIFYTMVKNQVEYDDTIWATRDAQREKRLEAKLKPRWTLICELSQTGINYTQNPGCPASPLLRSAANLPPGLSLIWFASALARDPPPCASPIAPSAPGLSFCDRLQTSCVTNPSSYFPAPRVVRLCVGAASVRVRAPSLTAGLLGTCVSL